MTGWLSRHAAHCSSTMRPLNFAKLASEETLSEADIVRSERILARLVARAFAAEHPELFAPRADRSTGPAANEDSSDGGRGDRQKRGEERA